MTISASSSIVAFFPTDQQAVAAMEALQQAGFRAHDIGAARRGGDMDSAGGKGEGMPVVGTMGFGHTVEHMWDRVRRFFDVHEGSLPEQLERNAKSIPDTDVQHNIASHGYAYDHGDLSYLLRGLSVPEERARYFEHRLSAQHGSVLLTVSAPEREAEAEEVLLRHGGDLGAAAATHDLSASTEPLPVAGQPRVHLLGEILRAHKGNLERRKQDVLPIAGEQPASQGKQ